MSEANPPEPAQPNPPAQLSERYEASSIVVMPRPNDFGFPLREDEFQILCDGQINEARALRDMCIGFFVTSIIAIVGLFATTDWTTVWQPERRTPFLIFGTVLFVITPASLAGWVVCQRNLKGSREDSPYSRLRNRIYEWFKSQVSPES